MARKQTLWEECQEYYDTHEVEDKVKSLEYKSSKKTIPPKLKAHAAGCRALIRFGHEVAQTYLDDADPVQQGAKAAAFHLWQCY